jgi:hypothetical protein
VVENDAVVKKKKTDAARGKNEMWINKKWWVRLKWRRCKEQRWGREGGGRRNNDEVGKVGVGSTWARRRMRSRWRERHSDAEKVGMTTPMWMMVRLGGTDDSSRRYGDTLVMRKTTWTGKVRSGRRWRGQGKQQWDLGDTDVRQC